MTRIRLQNGFAEIDTAPLADLRHRAASDGWQPVHRPDLVHVRNLIVGSWETMDAVRRALATAHDGHGLDRLPDNDIAERAAACVAAGRWTLYRKVPSFAPEQVNAGSSAGLRSSLARDAGFASASRAAREESRRGRVAPAPAVAPPTPSRRVVQPPPQPPPQPPLQPPYHWIEIELVGEDGVGISSEAYLVVLPGGRRVEGFLDEQGFARIDAFAQGGTCQVSFPRLDRGAWNYVDARPAMKEGA